jgi:hypothetical protein
VELTKSNQYFTHINDPLVWGKCSCHTPTRLTPLCRNADTVPPRSAHTSGTNDNLELKGCPHLLKFPVLLFLLAILNQHRRLPRLHRSNLLQLPRCRHRLVLCLRLNRCQHRLRSRGICLAPPRLQIRLYQSATSASFISRFSSSENDNVRACSRPEGDIFFQVFRNISIILSRSVLAMRSAS